jgi:hypothetical protein
LEQPSEQHVRLERRGSSRDLHRQSPQGTTTRTNFPQLDYSQWKYHS